ncbi:MAG: hypothetical protein C6P37_02860 [Caldibacillus debilis]|uniref:Uncharacterized protein n=1 Tax=Caldibacillus debilis TaxID=301148 RepID=A0A3E0K7D6_9BACI|nr:MAG: hypothetical protein C6P37_02860 [Caldibacillus debilis]
MPQIQEIPKRKVLANNRLVENIDRENEGKQAADGFSQKPLMEKRSGPAAGRSVNPILSKTAADENVCTEHSQEIFDRGNPGKKAASGARTGRFGNEGNVCQKRMIGVNYM